MNTCEECRYFSPDPDPFHSTDGFCGKSVAKRPVMACGRCDDWADDEDWEEDEDDE